MSHCQRDATASSLHPASILRRSLFAQTLSKRTVRENSFFRRSIWRMSFSDFIYLREKTEDLPLQIRINRLNTFCPTVDHRSLLI